MAGRTKPNWAVFEGGPLHGERRLLPITQGPGPFAAGGAVYDLTNEYRRGEMDGGMRLGPARVARYVRALADEPIAPATASDLLGVITPANAGNAAAPG
jgi:hypothetical protein